MSLSAVYRKGTMPTITWKDVPKDLLPQREGHGFPDCDCDLGPDLGEPCTIQPPYEYQEDYIMRLIMRVMKAESALEKAAFTLKDAGCYAASDLAYAALNKMGAP